MQEHLLFKKMKMNVFNLLFYFYNLGVLFKSMVTVLGQGGKDRNFPYYNKRQYNNRTGENNKCD
jgi:hypothetical protein